MTTKGFWPIWKDKGIILIQAVVRWIYTLVKIRKILYTKVNEFEFVKDIFLKEKWETKETH